MDQTQPLSVAQQVDPAMEEPGKVRVLVFLGVAVVVLLILAASLSQLELHTGRPFSLGGTEPAVGGGDGPQGGGGILLLVVRGILTLALVLLPVYIIIHLLTSEVSSRLRCGISK